MDTTMLDNFTKQQERNKERVKLNLNYAKWSEGDTRVKLLDVAPYPRYYHFVTALNGKKRTVTCGGKGNCPLCGVEGVQNKVGVTFVIYNYTTQKVELWETSMALSKQILALKENASEMDKDILDMDINVNATGKGLERRYAVTLKKRVQEVEVTEELPNLEEIYKILPLPVLTGLAEGKSLEELLDYKREDLINKPTPSPTKKSNEVIPLDEVEIVDDGDLPF